MEVRSTSTTRRPESATSRATRMAAAAALSPSGETKMAREAPPAISRSAAVSMLTSPSFDALRETGRATATGAAAMAGAGGSGIGGDSRRHVSGDRLDRLDGSRRRAHVDFGDRFGPGPCRRPHGAAAEQLGQKRDDRHHEQRGDERGDADRHHLGEVGLGGRRRALEDARVDRRIVALVARGGLAVAGHVGFEQLALGRRFALQRPELDLLLAGTRRLGLQMVEIGDQLVLAHCAPSSPRFRARPAPSPPRCGSGRRGRRAAS